MDTNGFFNGARTGLDAFEHFLTAAVVTRCLNTADGPPAKPGEIDDLIDRLTHVLRSAAGSVTGAQRTRSEALPRHKLRAVVDYVESNLEEPIRVSAMAAVVGVSLYHFSRLFRAATGLAPHQYVLRARMRRAAHLLVATESNVSSIALEVGCVDQSHLTSSFRRLFGCTPREFRKSVRNGDAVPPAAALAGSSRLDGAVLFSPPTRAIDPCCAAGVPSAVTQAHTSLGAAARGALPS